MPGALSTIPMGIDWTMIIAITVFLIAIGSMMFEWIDKTLIMLIGVCVLGMTGAIQFNEVISMIDFTTIILLFALMIMVEIVRKSQVLAWVNVRMVRLTHGNPFLLFLVFALTTLVVSTFLANTTTMMILIPLTIAITRGMDINPTPYIIVEIISANVGGTLTIIGDPANVMISSANDIAFFEFTRVVFLPIAIITVLYISILTFVNWSDVKPIATSLTKLFMTNMLLKKLEYQFTKSQFHLRFAQITVGIFLLTIIAFIWDIPSIPIEYIALTSAAVLLLLTRKYVKIHEVLASVDVHTLVFFAGLFVVVGALEKTGALVHVSAFILTHSTSALGVSQLVLWTVGLLSAFVENIPLVAMMIPVLHDSISSGLITGNTDIVWYALSFGACLGGNGSLIGSSASILSAQIAEKNGIKISFREYFAFGYPLTLLSLGICSIYLYLIA